MKRIFLRSILFSPLLFIIACSGEKSIQDVIPTQVLKSECQQRAIPNQYIVKWTNGQITKIKSGSMDEFIKEVVEPQLDNIQIAEPDYTIKLDKPNYTSSSFETPNWHHIAIDSEYAWSRGYRGQGAIVAVIDSGIEPEHSSFQGQLYVNQREIPGNGIDDDGNSLVDDVSGYDFFLNTSSLSDPGSHGTHVSGIVAGRHSSSNSVKGVAPEAKILPLRFLGPNGEGSLSDAVRAIDYAGAQGAHIINASWGSSTCSETLNESVRNLIEKNVLFITAAGNESINIDYYPVYPGAIQAENLINVAATSANGPLSYFTNYGFRVHLAAPGTNIYSSLPGNSAGYMSGTSMAAPIVTGVAAIVKSILPNANYALIRDIIIRSVKPRNLYVDTRGEVDIKDVVEEALKRSTP